MYIVHYISDSYNAYLQSTPNITPESIAYAMREVIGYTIQGDRMSKLYSVAM